MCVCVGGGGGENKKCVCVKGCVTRNVRTYTKLATFNLSTSA